MDRERLAHQSAVSVIIPTHLRPLLLSEAILSVIAQTHPAAEIIVVDDATDHATRDVVHKMNETSPVPLVYIPNMDAPGACGSRNAGAARAASAKIAFLDDDDLWRPSFLEELLQRLTEVGADFVMSGLYRHEEGRPPELRLNPTGLGPENVVAFPRSMTGTNVLYCKEAFLSVGGFDRNVPVFNDWDLFIRLIDAGHCYDVVPLGLADWRWHSGDRIATFSLKRAKGLRLFLGKYGYRMEGSTHRDFKTTAIGIERRNAAGLKRLWKSGELLFAHGPIRSVSRLFRAQVVR